MSEARLQILKMLEEGKITAREAAELLAAVEKPKAQPSTQEALRGRWMRVLVINMATNRQKINVSVPLGMVDVALRMGARFAPKSSSFDPQEILEAIRSGERGLILKIEDQEDGERVEVYID